MARWAGSTISKRVYYKINGDKASAFLKETFRGDYHQVTSDLSFISERTYEANRKKQGPKVEIRELSLDEANDTMKRFIAGGKNGKDTRQ